MVHYTAGGNWRPSIPNVTCGHCGVIFTAHSKTQRYCTKKCAQHARRDAWQAAHYTERTCPGCATAWRGPPSNPSQYCSKACIFDSGAWERKEDRECEECGTVFSSRRRRARDGWGRFCSVKCKDTPRQQEERTCAQCGEPFMINRNLDNQCCSRTCRDAFYVRSKAPAWTGGIYYTDDIKRRRIDRPGYAAKYEGEHRIIAGRAIGRPIERGEVVIWLDRDHANNDPSNLFICGSQSERGHYQSGGWPWPTHSNLDTYGREGYRPPRFRIKARNAEGSTRHPLAGAIIRRREEGASLRALAEEFGMSLSGMANVVKNRL